MGKTSAAPPKTKTTGKRSGGGTGATARKKAVAGSSAATATAAATAAAPAVRGDGRDVRVRMYRQGLGDCFLLTLPTDTKPFHVLIDCGVILGTPGQDTTMRNVAEQIRKETEQQVGGKVKSRIDVLIATHEHWDHLSGFLQAEDVFANIEIGQLWLAWTEDRSHPLARKLRRQKEQALKALAAAVPRLKAAGSDSAAALNNVLGFTGLGAANGKTTAKALEFLRKRQPNPRFLRPGDVLDKVVPGVRIYVLGPPEDEKLIKKSDPTKKGKEVYDFAFGFEFETGFMTALDRLPTDREPKLKPDDWERTERSLPFDKDFRLPVATAKKHAFFARRYFAGGGAAPPAGATGQAAREREIRNADRRIDCDWLEAAGGLALKLDSDTNNTSLALAIELTATGKVLLFPADAQVGNWLSWANLIWPPHAKADDPQAVTAAKLLSRTVVYKVGHHGSHNATMRAAGLELMESPELVAFIPVDEDVARNKKDWDMPFGALLKRLKEKTRGRIIRADRSLARLKSTKPPGASGAEWNRFTKALSADPKDKLYIEYTLRG